MNGTGQRGIGERCELEIDITAEIDDASAGEAFRRTGQSETLKLDFAGVTSEVGGGVAKCSVARAKRAIGEGSG